MRPASSPPRTSWPTSPHSALGRRCAQQSPAASTRRPRSSLEAQRLPGIPPHALDVARSSTGSSMQQVSPARATLPRSDHRSTRTVGRLGFHARARPPSRARSVRHLATDRREPSPPLQLRGRAIGVLLAVGTAQATSCATVDLREPPSHVALAARLQRSHRYGPPDPEDQPGRPKCQQNLLAPPNQRASGGATVAAQRPPRIMRSAVDWFDCGSPPPRRTWIGMCGLRWARSGRGNGISAVTLGRFSPYRREAIDPAEVSARDDEVLLMEIGRAAQPARAATIGHWNAPASMFR